jgi:hypothetical protein
MLGFASLSRLDADRRNIARTNNRARPMRGCDRE